MRSQPQRGPAAAQISAKKCPPVGKSLTTEWTTKTENITLTFIVDVKAGQAPSETGCEGML